MGDPGILVAVAGYWLVMMDRSIGMLSSRLAVKLALLVAGSMLIGASRERMQVEVLDIPGVSSPQWESHPAEDPLTGDLWFVRSDEKFLGWRLWVSRCADGRFEAAVPVPIAAPGLEADPVFVDGGRRILFISSRRTGANRSADLDIWQSMRTQTGWTEPEPLPVPVNSASAEWFPRAGTDGWLYFGSAREGGQGMTDIWRARRGREGRWTVENLGPGVNTAEHEYEFAILPGGRTAVLATDHGLYAVSKRGSRWVRGAKFGEEINRNGTEIGPVPFGNSGGFVFSRDIGDGRSGELLAVRMGHVRASPFRCTAMNGPGQR